MVGLLASTQTFYFIILEEYYTGGMFLPIVNGVTDGSLLIIGFYIYCGVWGLGAFSSITEINYGGQTYFI
jgi:hypothetical protein